MNKKLLLVLFISLLGGYPALATEVVYVKPLSALTEEIKCIESKNYDCFQIKDFDMYQTGYLFEKAASYSRYDVMDTLIASKVIPIKNLMSGMAEKSWRDPNFLKVFNTYVYQKKLVSTEKIGLEVNQLFGDVTVNGNYNLYRLLVDHGDKPKPIFVEELGLSETFQERLCSTFVTSVHDKKDFPLLPRYEDAPDTLTQTIGLYRILKDEIGEDNIVKTCFYCPDDYAGLPGQICHTDAARKDYDREKLEIFLSQKGDIYRD